MASTSVRLPDDLLQGLDALAESEHTDRAVVLRRAIERGLRDLQLDRALDAYHRGEGSFAWCAEQAGVGLWDAMEELRRRGSGVATDEEHLLAQIEDVE